jgi:hypothetical protein
MINCIRNAASNVEKIYWNDHALLRMRQRAITIREVVEVAGIGDIIEEYHEDKPFPSVLISGRCSSGRTLHVVIGVNSAHGEIYIITCYEPEPSRWDENFSKRRKK